MKNRFLIFSLLFVFFMNTVSLCVLADGAPILEGEEATKAEALNQQIIKDTTAPSVNSIIENNIKNGWSSEFAESNTKTIRISPYQSEIELVTLLNIMSAGSDGDFRDEDNLSYVEFANAIQVLARYDIKEIDELNAIPLSQGVMCKVVLSTMSSILGYDSIGDQQSGYRLNTSQDKLLLGLALKGEESIKREQMAKLIANALELDMMEQTSFGDTSKYEVIKGQTLLSNMDIVKVKGWLNATYETNIYSASRPLEGNVQIDRATYLIGDTNAKSLLGNYVTAYAREVNDQYILIKVDINEKKNNRICVNKDDVYELSKDSLVYYELDKNGEQNDKTNSVSFSGSAIVVYNGRYAGTVETVVMLDILPQTGNISVIDTDFDNKYDVIMVENYRVGVVTQVADDKVVLKYERGILDLSDTEKVVNIIRDGEAIKVSDLLEWNVLSVAISQDLSLYTVYTSGKSVAGEVVSKSENKLLLDDTKEYKVDISFTNNIELGKYYVFYFTKDGKIAGANMSKSSANPITGSGRNYAYLKECGVEKGLTDKAKFRLFKIVAPAGEWVTLEGTDKMTLVDGASMVDNGQIGTVITRQRLTPREVSNHPSIKDKPQLIVYETDASGKISSITTAKSVATSGVVDDDVFTYNAHLTEKIRTYYGGYFGGIYHKGTCQLVCIPTDKTKEKLYALEPMATDGYVIEPIDIYDADSKLVLNGIVLRYADSNVKTIADGYKTFVVNKVWSAVDEENNAIWKVSDFSNNIYSVESADENIGIASVLETAIGHPYNVTKVSQLKQGDAITVNVNINKYITTFRLDFRVSDLSGVKYFSYGTDKPAKLSYDYGVVVKNPKGTSVVMNTVGNGTASINNKPRIVTGQILLYDTQKNKMTLLDNKQSILEGDVIFTKATYYYNELYTIVIR